MDNSHIFDMYLKPDKLPHLWCPGCGNGIVLQAIIRAIDSAGVDPNKTVIVSGIGCSSRAVGYLNLCGMQANHGRALACATGIKMAAPELTVIVITGDGDCCSIGGNHFIHAARRNIDLTVVVFNNFNYGMTGGQYSSCTPLNSKTKTSVYGSIEKPFDICELAVSAGAVYAARSGTFYAQQLSQLISGGIQHRGFSVIDAICDCPSLYGRLNGYTSPYQMLAHQADFLISAAEASRLGSEALEGKLIRGIISSRSDRTEYTDEYRRLIQKARDKNDAISL